MIHRGQKASNALLLSIQLVALPGDRLTAEVNDQLVECNKTVLAFGSRELCELQRQLLLDNQEKNPSFYADALKHIEVLFSERFSEAA